ncbi:hypothetical protein CTI12_AA475930 [Artemisia annua]|uniref:DUF8040 domain-containing protein n=1 Tax=Artemisia annua TaxID=35608 RepID=A0A2U1LMC8_ARTAN|nr:hypothetical protein CTI12_AA475930 [Artemisia annua]
MDNVDGNETKNGNEIALTSGRKKKADEELEKFRGKNLEMYKLSYYPLFRDTVAVGDKKSSSSKRKKSSNNGSVRSTKSKNSVTSEFDEKLDSVIHALSSRSTQSFPSHNSTPSTKDCMNIVTQYSGFEEGTKEYFEALKIFLKKEVKENFMMDVDSEESDSYDEDEENWVEEENNFLLSCAIAIKGIIMSRKLKKKPKPCRTSSRTGYLFIQDILNGHERRCYEVFRLQVPVFKMLCVDLVQSYGFKPSRHISIEESVAIFLTTLAHGCGNRLFQETFSHSGETIH